MSIDIVVQRICRNTRPLTNEACFTNKLVYTITVLTSAVLAILPASFLANDEDSESTSLIRDIRG